MATVTIATIVKNEADRFLRRALECWCEVSDRIVAVDNGSDDRTKDILAEFGAVVHDFRTPMDGNEHLARAFLWDRAVEATPDGWIVHLDADQCVADDFRPHLTGNRVLFPVFDMWSATEYRSDAWWRVRPWWQAVRMSPDVEADWIWPDRGWHSGHVPANSGAVFGAAAHVPYECAILHYGYATPELRQRHYSAYMARKAVLTDREVFHARTIIDERPRLETLPFGPRYSLL